MFALVYSDVVSCVIVLLAASSQVRLEVILSPLSWLDHFSNTKGTLVY